MNNEPVKGECWYVLLPNTVGQVYKRYIAEITPRVVELSDYADGRGSIDCWLRDQVLFVEPAKPRKGLYGQQ